MIRWHVLLPIDGSLSSHMKYATHALGTLRLARALNRHSTDGSSNETNARVSFICAHLSRAFLAHNSSDDE